MRITTRHPETGAQQVIGDLEGAIFRVYRDSRKHKLHTPPAYAVQESFFTSTHFDQVKFIVIQELDTQKIYKTPAKLWLDRGFHLDRGFGKQRALLFSDIEAATATIEREKQWPMWNWDTMQPKPHVCEYRWLPFGERKINRCHLCGQFAPHEAKKGRKKL